MSQFTILNGQRMDLKNQLRTLKLRAENHVMTIRQKIDPLLELEEMEIENAEQAMISLKVIAGEAKKIQDKIDKINDQIGDE